MFDNSSDEELDMVIETDEISIMLPSLSELVKDVDNTQLLPAIRLCLAWLIRQARCSRADWAWL